MNPQDLYASKKAEDFSYFIPPVESEKPENNDSPLKSMMKTPLMESNVIVENDATTKICKVF